MTRRKRLKPCRLSGKGRYTSEDAAKRLGANVIAAWCQTEVGKHMPQLRLWVYRCKHEIGGCGDWHLTRQDQGDEHRVPWGE